MRDVPISRVMTTDPITVEADQPLLEARSLLESGNVHHLPVVEGGRLVGIMSTADLLKFFMLDENTVRLPVLSIGQVMQPDPIALHVNATLSDAAIRLSGGGFHALPIVETDGTLVGIVTTTDLIQHLLRHVPTGDGSIRTQQLKVPVADSGEAEIAAAIREAEAERKRGIQTGTGRALLCLYEQNQLLQKVCQAAELYERSGHADREHSVLVRQLTRLRQSAGNTLL